MVPAPRQSPVRVVRAAAALSALIPSTATRGLRRSITGPAPAMAARRGTRSRKNAAPAQAGERLRASTSSGTAYITTAAARDSVSRRT
ncbi:hypothetical protein KNE206_53050 [Kitasatospora sp. NE20-6]